MERPAGAEQKCWGWTEELNRQTYEKSDGSIAVRCRTVRVFIKAGGYSSVHCHRQCANIFSVISGKLLLRRCRGIEPFNPFVEIAQEPGDRPITFGTGIAHQFHALTDVLALEIYIADPDGTAGPEDIERFTKNGLKLEQTMCGFPIVITDHGNFPKGDIRFERLTDKIPVTVKKLP